MVAECLLMFVLFYNDFLTQLCGIPWDQEIFTLIKGLFFNQYINWRNENSFIIIEINQSAVNYSILMQ